MRVVFLSFFKHGTDSIDTYIEMLGAIYKPPPLNNEDMVIDGPAMTSPL